MLNNTFSIADYLVLIFLLVMSSLIGVYFWFKSRKSGSNEEFLTGDRKLGLLPVTLSLVASFMSTSTLLGLPAEVFQVGTQFSIQIFSITFAVIFAAEVFMPIYYKLELLSVNEYLAKRFKSKSVRMAGTLGFLLTTLPYMAVVLYGPALALSSVTPLSIPTSILVCGIVCTLYTSIGGIKAVIWTDVLQCLLMFLGVIMVIVQGCIELGGFREIINTTKEGGRLIFFNMKYDLYNHGNFWNVIIGTTVDWSATYCITQTQVQRYCSMGSAKKAKRTLYWNLPGLIILAVMSVMAGMVVFSKYHNCDPVTLGVIERHDQLMPYYVMDTLSRFPGLPGLFVACVFSGSLSTLSSGFNALAAVTWEDLIKDRIKIRKDKELTVTKLIAMSYGLLSIALSFGVGNFGTVLQASIGLVGSALGPLFGIFIMGILYPYATAPGALIGFLCGISLSLTISFGALVIPKPTVSLQTSLTSCPIDVINATITKFNVLPNSTYIPSYNPEGAARLFHITYLLIPVLGFFACLIVGSLLSLFIGEKIELDEPSLMSPMHKYLFPWSNTGRKEVYSLNSNYRLRSTKQTKRQSL